MVRGPAGVASGRLVFVSHSHEDAEWLRRFLVMLQPLVRNRRLEVWADEHIRVGDEWRRDIDDAVDRAAVALLLVSPDFLASRFVMDVELPALLRRGVRLVPVLVRPCLWQVEPALERVQWAHDPGRDGPLSRSPDPEGVIVRICRGIHELLPAAPLDGATAPVLGRAEPVADLAYAAHAGRAHGVPPPPRAYVERTELATLKSMLLEGGTGLVGLTGNARALGLHGQGGIGKSVLAAALALDPEVAHRFPDGLFWVSPGENADVVAAQIDLLRRLGVEEPEVRSTSQGARALRGALAGRGCLLIVDDVWSDAAATAFDVAGSRGRVLYTTRDLEVLRAVGARAVPVAVLPDSAGRELLARLAGTTPDRLPAEVDRILAATGGVALALTVVGAAVARGGRGWAEVADQLERGSATFLDHPYADTFKAMRVGLAALPAEQAELYRTLAVCPEDTPVAVQAVARLWWHQFGRTAEETRDMLRTLAARDLLVLDGEAIRFHDLQRAFLLLEAEDVALLHRDLLDAYRALLPAGATRWSALPPDEPYIWSHLLRHLRGAGDRVAMLAVAHDVGYLTVRIWHDGAHAGESDLRQVAALHPDDEDVRWLLRLMEQSGHLFGPCRSLADLAATVASQIEGPPHGVDVTAMRALLPERYLVPQWGFAQAAAFRRGLSGHHGSLRTLAFSPDGRTLASSGDDGTVRLWNPASGQCLTVLESHGGSVLALAFSPDGRTLVSGGDDGRLRFWDLPSGDCVARPESHTGAVVALAWSPDGRTIASAGGDGVVRLWDTASERLLDALGRQTGWVNALAFSPDSRTLASAGDDGAVRLWDQQSRRCTATLEGHTGWVRALAFSPDGRTLASAGDDRRVRLWDHASTRPLGALRDHTDWIRALAFSPDGRLLASAGDDGGVRLWDPSSGRCLGALKGHTGRVRTLAFSPDGCTLATAGNDRVVHLWDPDAALSQALSGGHGDWVLALALSPDGRTVASADHDVRLWDPATGRALGALVARTGRVRALAFSPDARVLAAGGDRGVLSLWEPISERCLATLTAHRGRIRALAFSPDGRLLASAGDSGRVGLWDPASGQRLATAARHAGPVQVLAFSPHDGTLVSGGHDRTLRIWDATRGRCISALGGHTGRVRALAFSPDGRTLATGDDEGLVRLWDPAEGRCTAAVEGHTGRVRALAFSPDGCTLATAGWDRVVRLWDVERMDAVATVGMGLCAAAAWTTIGLAVALGNRIALMSLVERD